MGFVGSRLRQLLMQEALEDRQLEQMDANLAREERWELREGEFDDRPYVSTAAPFDADSYVELEPGTHFSDLSRLDG